MATHRVRRRPITRSDDEVFERGDEIDPTEAELRAFGDNLEEIDEEDEADGEVSDGESGTLPFNPESNTIDEIEEKIEGVDDAAAIEAVLNLERDQKDRDGATDAIEARLEEV